MAVGTLPRPDLVHPAVTGRLDGSRAWRKLGRNPAAILGALVLVVVIGAALTAPIMAPHDPARQSLLRRLTPPVWEGGGTAAYPLGTDQVGRDMLSRLIHGARISLLVGIAAVVVSLLVGVTLGLVSGFVGGRVDTSVMTVVDVFLSFPQILLALAFVAALGPSLVTIIVLSTLQVAQAILQESALSFLGVGSGTAHPTWGQMISQGRDFVSVAWWLPTLPGLAILLTVLAINLVGDRLRDALDPRG